MLPHQYRVSIALTFAMGMFAGAYLYLTGFATTFEPPEASEANVYTEFVITAESYGECELKKECLSFQVLESGIFRAIMGFRGESLIKEERIPQSLRSELDEILTATTLTLESEVSNLGCRYEDTNYRFRVTRDEVEYIIDTCGSAIDYDGSAWKILAKLWNHMASLEW